MKPVSSHMQARPNPYPRSALIAHAPISPRCAARATSHGSINPPHPLSDFSLKAGIDWVEVEVEFSRPTQAKWVRSRFPAGFVNAFVTPLGTDEYSCESFRFRVQDPQDPVHLESMLRQLDPEPAKFNPGYIRIVGMEVFLDAVPRQETNMEDLVRAAEYLLRHHAHPPMGKHIITAKGRYMDAALRRDVMTALREGITINGGEGPCRERVYVKQHDTKDGAAYEPLPIAQWCARMETTLSGSLVPFSNLAEWRTYQFATLSRYFRCVKQDPPRTEFTGLLRDQVVRLGKPRDFVNGGKGRRFGRLGTSRDSELNQRIADALRALTRRTQRCANS